MASTDAPLVSSRVPFKWEEAAGKPITAAAHTLQPPYAPETIELDLQLPPKLQFPLPRSPLSLPHSPCEGPSWLLHQSSPLGLQGRHSPSPNPHKLKRFYTYMLKNSPWSHPIPHHHTPPWSSSACAITDSQHNEFTIDERLFFDKALPKQFKYSVSLPDSWKAHLPIHREYKQGDARVKSEALSVLAMEEQEAESNASSPFHPIMFHERHGSACTWQAPPTIKAAKNLGGDEDEDDEDEDEVFHDFFSTASSSLEKPSERTDDSMESSCASPPPSWFLDFGPEELQAHEEKERSNLVVRLVAIVKLKKIISSKVCKLRKRTENHNSMWSPTLATYLFNEQNEEKEEGTYARTIHSDCVAEEDDDSEEEDHDNDDTEEAESASMSSATSSHRFRINPDYHPPSSILRAHLHFDDNLFEGEASSSFRVQFSQELGADDNEEQQHRTLSHRLSLREQLAEFDDEYPLEFSPNDQSLAPPIFDSQQKQPAPCKGMCKVRSTVKILVSSIKLILVQTEGGKRKGQRPSLYGGCFKPNVPALSAFPSTHNPKLHK